MASSSSSTSENSNPVERPANFKLLEEAISSLRHRISDASGSILQASENDSNIRCQPEKICRDLNHIMDVFTKLGEFGSEASTSAKELSRKLDDLLASIEDSSSKPVDQSLQIQALVNGINKLKGRLPSLPYRPSAIPYINGKRVIGDQFSVNPEISSLYSTRVHQYGFTVDEFKEIFEGLDDQMRKYLLFFAVFPSDSVVSKRALKNWWDGEGLVDLSTDEEITNIMVERLTARCLIKSLREKCALIGFEMNPLIRPMVVGRAEAQGFFCFNSWGDPSFELSKCNRAFLVNGNYGQEQRSLHQLELASSRDDLDIKKLQTLFNINESYPDFTLDLFLKLKNLRVLSLGRWQGSNSDHHIELESTKFLEALKFMKSLRYLSLRGVSRIFELPNSVCKLISLRILDLNACHNLEELPDSIGSLKNLISLDISECYLLEKIPKTLALLTKLRILKGFLVTNEIGEGCSFTDLNELKKLIKLSVNANRHNFPNTEDFHTFKKFELLEKLTISWGGKSKSISMNEAAVKKPLKKILSKLGSMKQENESIKPVEVPENCFKSLKKLNLQCYPHEEVEWLKPQHFNSLNKLSIQGGKLRKLPEFQNDDCWKKVESLHLKFLSELQISLLHLKGSFPDLTYLEVISCDKLVGRFDGDESWLKEHHSATLRIQNNAGRDDEVRGTIWLKGSDDDDQNYLYVEC